MPKKNNQIALRTLLAGLIIHFILATFHTWQSILRYFNSYLLELNEDPIDPKYLEVIFSISNVPHALFMILSVILTGYFSSLKITGIGLIIRSFSESLYLFYPNIKIVTMSVVISSCANGLIYLPVILDILRYYPKSKGVCVSFVLIGYGMNRLMFKYISINIIDPDSVEMMHQTNRYPSYINNNFRLYLKIYLMFYAFLSTLSIYLLHPYKTEKVEDESKFFQKRKLTTDPSTFANVINIDKNFEEEDKNGNGINIETENEIENEDNYIKILFRRKKNKNDIKKIRNIKLINKYEPFSSLVISYPFMQLTLIFFFTNLIGLVELSSIRKLGTLNGHSEIFLWNTSFIFKALNAVFLPVWGYIFDKVGFKKLYSVILTIQLIISSLCFFISSNAIGFILYNGISALLHSVNICIHISSFVLIFGNEKGILLYSISWLLIYIFYIGRPYISNLFVSKIYYLMFYIGLTLFTMIALIILSFFVEKKHVYTGERKIDDSSSDEENELEDLQFSDSEEDNNNEEDNNKKMVTKFSKKNVLKLK